MRPFVAHATRHAGRRSFLLGTAGALAAGLTAPLGWLGSRRADAGALPLPAHGPVPLPAPQPIPGGFNIPPLIHEFIPGPETITLPFTRITLQGLHVEPSTINNFTGVTALAYHVGTVTGSDGRTYDLETDVRVFQGQSVGEDGSPRQGTFGEMWIDLFTPGPGEQVHDYNGGIPPSGLFWTVELPPGAFVVSHDHRHAVLQLRDLPLIDTFTFFGPSDTPAVLNMTITWEALEAPVALGAGATVPPTDPAAFLGRFARARSTAHYSGRQLGFSFRSDPGASADDGYAELGTERNGVSLWPIGVRRACAGSPT